MLDVGLSLFVCLFVYCKFENLWLLKFPIHQNQNKTYPGFEHELTRRDLWGNVEISPGERGRCGRWRSFIKWDDILINYMGESLHNVYRYQITTGHTLLSQLNKGEIKQNHWLTGWFTVSVSVPARACALSTACTRGQWVMNSADVHIPESNQTPQSEALLAPPVYTSSASPRDISFSAVEFHHLWNKEHSFLTREFFDATNGTFDKRYNHSMCVLQLLLK